MKVKATVLCENSVFSNLGAIAEHGWSIFLETDQGNFLFDTGQGLALLNNARVLKKDLTSVKGIILSHHHCDHTGGLLDALSVTGPVHVYSHPDLFKEGYLIRTGTKFIGVPFTRIALEDKGAQLKFNTAFTEIAPGLYLTGEVPRLTAFEIGDTDVVLKTADGFSKDPLLDDQSVVIETKQVKILSSSLRTGINRSAPCSSSL